MSAQAPPRRAKHLMDPTRPPVRSSSGMSLTTVQRWIMSSLILVTIELHAAAVVVAAVFVDAAKTGNRIGLLAIAAALATGGVVAFRLVHHKTPLSPYLAAGAIPALVGAWVCFGH